MLPLHISSAKLPTPSSDALRHSLVLAERIRDEIRRNSGWIDFARYMDLALYSPGLGYYSAGSTKLGRDGDFVTAPELSDLLGRAFAATLHAELAVFDSPTILELGAGTGVLAAQLLEALAALGLTNVSYRILEPSADLQERQRRTLARFGARVRWLETLPLEPFTGAIVANEVLDALPVSRFVKRSGRTLPLGVIDRDGRFAWGEGPARSDLEAAVAEIESACGATLPDGYVSEACLILPQWVAGLAASLESGCMLFADYGLPRRDFYHGERSAGTLMCHYRHRAHDDPFLYPGLQDLTAWVDFSACAAAAVAAGLAVAGFTTQGQYLLGTLAATPPPLAFDAESVRELSALKTLILPGEMGERFKVLLLSKGRSPAPLPGRDFRDRL